MFKNLLYFSILTATVVASWIGFSIYHGYTASTISSTEAVIITPIPSGFDREVIEKIKTKKTIKVDLTEEVDETAAEQASASAEQASASAEQI